MRRSATSTSPPVVATTNTPAVPTNLGIPLNVPPWLDTGPTPSDTQNSTQSPDSDRFLTITSSRGRATTTAAAAFPPPETVGVPQVPANAFAALAVQMGHRSGLRTATALSSLTTDHCSGLRNAPALS